VHVEGAVQLPPLPHVCSHTGVVQFESNQPRSHAHVSGAAHAPRTHVCAHCGSTQPSPP